MTIRRLALTALFLLAVLIVLAGLWFFRNLFMLAFLAVVLAVLASIPASYLRRLRLPRALAVAVSVVGLLVSAAALTAWLVPSVAGDLYALARRLPAFSDQLTGLYDRLSNRDDLVGQLLPPRALGYDAVVTGMTPATTTYTFVGAAGDLEAAFTQADEAVVVTLSREAPEGLLANASE